jgi:hypothetical protein
MIAAVIDATLRSVANGKHAVLTLPHGCHWRPFLLFKD